MARSLAKKEQESHRELEDKRCCTLYVDDPSVFPVDKIVDVRAVTTEIEYLVQWTGYSAEHNEWVTERNVTPELKRAFSRDRKKNVLNWFKVSRTQAILKNHSMTTKNGSLSTTIKTVTKHEIYESFEEYAKCKSEVALSTALKNEESR